MKYLTFAEMLLITKVDVNIHKCFLLNEPTLQAAVEQKHLEMVRKFLSANVDVKVKADNSFG